MHDVPVGVIAEQRRGRGAEGEVADGVVLDQERASGAHGLEHLRLRSAASVAPCGFANVGCRYTSRAPVRSSASASRSGRMPCSSAGTGTGCRPGRGRQPGRRDRSAPRRSAAARRHQPAQAGGERRLPARADQDLPRGGAARRREARAQRSCPQAARGPRRPAGARRAPARPRVQPSAAGPAAGSRWRERTCSATAGAAALERVGVDRTGAERDRLPRRVGLPGRLALGHERAAPRPRLHQPAGDERGDGPLHGRRPGPVPGHQLSHRRQPRTRRRGGHLRLDCGDIAAVLLLS